MGIWECKGRIEVDEGNVAVLACPLSEGWKFQVFHDGWNHYLIVKMWLWAKMQIWEYQKKKGWRMRLVCSQCLPIWFRYISFSKMRVLGMVSEIPFSNSILCLIENIWFWVVNNPNCFGNNTNMRENFKSIMHKIIPTIVRAIYCKVEQ